MPSLSLRNDHASNQHKCRTHLCATSMLSMKPILHTCSFKFHDSKKYCMCESYCRLTTDQVLAMSKMQLRVIETSELLGPILPLLRHGGRSPDLTGPDRGHQGSHLHCAMPSLAVHNDHATIKHSCCTHNDRHCNNSNLRATIIN